MTDFGSSVSWPFCRCGTILDLTDTGTIQCSTCGFRTNFTDCQMPEVVTRSASRTKPAWLIDDGADGDDADGNENVIIEEPCPKCGHPEQYFYTMQLRSVDEGSTVFYECPNCNNKYSVNN